MPVDIEYLGSLDIEKFDGARHNRAPFTCGVNCIDNFLKITATKYVKDDNGRIYVAVEREERRLAGFYAIVPHAIDAISMDGDLKKRLPNFDRIPSIYLSMIATHTDRQKKGLGGFLLADA